MEKKDVNFFFKALEQMYPHNTSELIWNTPRQLLVAVVLSAQTTDKQVNKTTKELFSIVETPYDTINLGQKKRYYSIRSVNYAPTKSKNLYKTAQLLTKEKDNPFYIIPKDLTKLLELPGVGLKTAKVIRHVLYDTNDIAVDTHVHRVLNRLGFVKTKNPLQTSKVVDDVIPDQYKHIAHNALIMFGRYHCQARNPRFNGTLKEFRDYFRKEVKPTLSA